MARKGENIRLRKDGRWEGRCTLWDKDGNKVMKSVYGKTYSDVKEKMALIRVENQKKLRSQGDDRSLIENVKYTDLAWEWLAQMKKLQKHSTYVKYRQIYTTHLERTFMDVTTSNVSLEDISYELSKRDFSSKSIRVSVYSVTNMILKYAQNEYGAPYHRLESQREYGKNVKTEIITQSEQQKLLRELYNGLRDEPMQFKLGMLMCLHTGLRLGEVCALKWSDIDFKNGLLYVNRTVQRIQEEGHKTKTVLREDAPKSLTSRREIPLPDTLFELLQSLYDPDANDTYIICENRPAEPRTMYNHYQKCLKDAKIDKKKFHSLRHSFATNSVNAGVDVKSLSEILGHADVSITLNRYVHPTVETKRKHMNAVSSIMGQYMGQENGKSSKDKA